MLPHRSTRPDHNPATLQERLSAAADDDAMEASSADHQQLRKATDVVKRFTHADRMHAWWYCQMLANPEHAGMLTLGEWRSLEALARRQGEALDAEIRSLDREFGHGRIRQAME